MSSALSLELASPLGQTAGAPNPGPLVYKTERGVTRCPRAFVWDGYERRCDRWECPVCAPKKSRETARILKLDAEVDAPAHVLCLTTVDPETTSERFKAGKRAVAKRLRRRGLRFEWYGHIEFTTGQGRLSGGYRRMHEHAPVKGLDGCDREEIEGLIRETWQTSLPGNPWRVELKELRTVGGLLHYLSMHHGKAPQRPPEAWRGMHHRPSRGYFHRPVKELREEAKAQLWSEGLAYSSGLDVEDARLLVDGQRATWSEQREASKAWREATAWTAPLEPTLEEKLALFSDEDIPF
jgi:hypothetical protein